MLVAPNKTVYPKESAEPRRHSNILVWSSIAYSSSHGVPTGDANHGNCSSSSASRGLFSGRSWAAGSVCVCECVCVCVCVCVCLRQIELLTYVLYKYINTQAGAQIAKGLLLVSPKLWYHKASWGKLSDSICRYAGSTMINCVRCMYDIIGRGSPDVQWHMQWLWPTQPTMQ